MNPISKRLKIETSIDYSAALPIEILKFVLSFLNIKDLRSAERTCKRWKAQALDCWKKVTIEKIGLVAVYLFQDRGCWRKVALFCFQQFTSQTTLLKEFIDRKLIMEKVKFLSQEEKAFIMLFHSDIQASKIEEVKKVDPRAFHFPNPVTGRTALEEAAVNGNIEIAKFLIENGAKEVMPINQNVNASALFLATVHCQPEMVHLLLKNGVLIEIGLMKNNKSFLYNVVNQYLYIKKEQRKQYFECLILILRAWITQKGSDYVANQTDATEALNHAISSNFLEIAELFMSYGINSYLSFYEKEKLVISAFYYKNLNMIKFLHQRKIFNFIDYLDFHERTVLFECAGFNATEILSYLIEIGVPKNQLDCDGATYLDYGKKEYDYKLSESLRFYIDSPTNETMTKNYPYPISLEECFNNQSDWNKLIDDEIERTILHSVSTEIFKEGLNKSDGIIMQLLNHGADPHFEDIDKITPLRIAEDTFASRRLEETPQNVERARAIIAKMKSIKKI